MKNFSIVFYDRSFDERPPIPQSITVDRYSRNMVGGPKSATLRAPIDMDRWELFKMLRCPVEIYAEDGTCVWWGYVNRVVFPHGVNMLGVGLNTLYNFVTVDYNGGSTTDASDAASVLEYGQKELLVTDANATPTQAAQTRDLRLADHKYARPEVEVAGPRNYVEIQCLGWYETLSWKYYTNALTNSVELTTQIAAIVTAKGQFFSGTIVENTAGITSVETRDGKDTALYYINQLLEGGTSNVRPLLAEADRFHYLRVYERTAEPDIGAADYLLREDGNLVTPLGALVPPEHCIAAAWVQIQGLTTLLTGLSAMRPFFIEEAEYSAEDDATQYKPAAGFEQHRLDSHIDDRIRNNRSRVPAATSGGSISSPTQPFAWAYANTVGAADASDSRDITITYDDFGNATSLVIFQVQFAGTYLIGCSATCDNPAEMMNAAVSKSGGSGTVLPLGGYVPQESGMPYANGIAYGAIVTLGVDLASGAEISCTMSTGTSGATFLQGYAWIVKISE